MERQLVITSSTTDSNVYIWDLQTGHTLATYKSNASPTHCFSLIGNDYFMTAHTTNPLIQIWNWKRDQVFLKCPQSEKISALASSNDGIYVVAASITGNLYVWEVSSGELLKIWSGHYKKINCVKFTSRDDFVITGGEDSLIKAWSLCDVISKPAGAESTVQLWSSHSLPITDIHCGFGGLSSRVFSTSLDRSCRVWNLSSGEEASMIFPVGVSAVTTDPSEHFLFVGSIDGRIFITVISSFASDWSSSSTPLHSNLQSNPAIQAHTKQINGLRVSREGDLLVSTSDDFSAKVWDIQSKNLLRTFSLHRGPISNVEVINVPRILIDSTITKKVTLEPLQNLKKFIIKQNREAKVDPVELVTCRFNEKLSDWNLPIIYHSDTITDQELQNRYLSILDESRKITQPKLSVEKDPEVENAKLKQRITELSEANAKWQTICNQLYRHQMS